MKRPLLFFIYHYLIPYGGLLLVNPLAATNRIKLYDPENEKNVLDDHKSLIYASWHQRFLRELLFSPAASRLPPRSLRPKKNGFSAAGTDLWCPNPLHG